MCGNQLQNDMMEPDLILSASRMCDMPAWYPDELIAGMAKRLESGKQIHTLVLWTKHPDRLLEPPLEGFLTSLMKAGIQVYVHVTITGMGNRVCGTDVLNRCWKPEPLAPGMDDSLRVLPELTNLLGNGRVHLRFDPVVRFVDANGQEFSNRHCFDIIAPVAATTGIRVMTFSILQSGVYRKVDRRFKKLGIQIAGFQPEEVQEIWQDFRKRGAALGIDVRACCVDGLPPSACIDGHILNRLHPEHRKVTARRTFSRPICHCTQSVDIGGWPPRLCPTGCDYCYARPMYV